MACHGCQTGDSTLRPLPKLSLLFVCVCPLAESLAQLSTAPKAAEIGIRRPRMGHSRNPLVIEVLSFGPLWNLKVWVWGALSRLPTGSCPDHQTNGSGSAPHFTNGEIVTLRER